MVDGRFCNARKRFGCGRPSPIAPTGSGPFAIAIDGTTHTIYVANSGDDTLSVIDGARCNAARTSGCAHPVATVAAGPGPAGIAIDPATHTLYVTDTGPGMDGSGTTVAVIDAASCNARNIAGCGQTPATAHVGQFPFFIAFNPANRTVYVTDAADNAVSMIDARTCHAGATAGCGRTAPTAPVGGFPIPVEVNRVTNTIYVGTTTTPPCP